jgi:diguanylate cyclase
LPSSTLGEAVEVVDRLRVATPLAQTFSAGVALWHGTETSDQLVVRADQALYRGKQAGRNQVVAAEPPGAGRRHAHDPAGMARLAAADRPSS